MIQITSWKPDGKWLDDAPDSGASLRREAFEQDTALDEEIRGQMAARRRRED
jgi:hypothetical protein